MEDDENIADDDKAQKDAAYECLDALFAYRVAPRFLDEFMFTPEPSGDRETLRQLQGWAKDIHTRFVEDGKTWVSLNSSTHREMQEHLRPFRNSSSNAMFKDKQLPFSPWPFVEIIRYHLSNPLLEQGNCLADVPGTRDVNIYRVAMATAYLQKCEKVIIVGDIKRLKSDSSFRNHYMEAYRRKRNGSVILYATRSDVSVGTRSSCVSLLIN